MTRPGAPAAPSAVWQEAQAPSDCSPAISRPPLWRRRDHRPALGERVHDLLVGGARGGSENFGLNAPGTPPHLGFVIDDVEGSPAVTADGDHVDLYGYTSLAIAALQAHLARSEVQEAELAALRAEVAAMRQALEQKRRRARGGMGGRRRVEAKHGGVKARPGEAWGAEGAS